MAARNPSCTARSGYADRMPTTASPRRPATRTTPRSRPSLHLRRKAQPQSKRQKVVGAVTKALPAAVVAKKATPSGKKRNVALLGIAGGLAAAIKNRDKLSFGKKAEPLVDQPPPAGTSDAIYVPPTATPQP